MMILDGPTLERIRGSRAGAHWGRIGVRKRTVELLEVDASAFAPNGGDD